LKKKLKEINMPRNPFGKQKAEYRESSFDEDRAREEYAAVQEMSIGEWYRKVLSNQRPEHQRAQNSNGDDSGKRRKDPSLEANWSGGSQDGGSDRRGTLETVGSVESVVDPLRARRNDSLPFIPNALERQQDLQRRQQEAMRARREAGNQPARGNTDRILDRLILEELESQGGESSQGPSAFVESPTSIPDRDRDEPPPYSES
jgi:hypothetical protein